MRYRSEIDGLRAIAVLSVMMFHAGFGAFSGGFVGVDVFFVISGFLITSILVRENSAGTFSFVTFYERRARRILPALYCVILICIPFAYATMLPDELIGFARSIIATTFFGANVYFWRDTDYFDGPKQRVVKLGSPEAEQLTVNALMLDALPQDVFVDVHAKLCPVIDRCRLFTPESYLLSFDGAHLTRKGARYLGRLVFDDPLLRPFSGNPPRPH